MKRILFYATPSDITCVLSKLEAFELLQFVEMGNRTTIERPNYSTVADIPTPGIATNSTGSASVSYLVSMAGNTINQTEIEGKSGARRWTLANSENPSSVVLTMAGLWKRHFILPGTMSTMHSEAVPQKIMNNFIKSINQAEFVKHNLYWVGPEAVDMSKSGARLTPSETSPSEYDLRIC